ncbi:MAG: 30S ribosomal protein S8 [Candidatus Woesearchaeota archaeon]|nr:30S ribosomal protein S8 [Candidatus Woesearchaeota archaeon]
MLNDPIANALSKVLKQEELGRREVLLHPTSNILSKILTILNEQGYAGITEELSPSRGRITKLFLTGNINKCGAIKPRFTVKLLGYEKFEKRYLPAKGVGVLIVSTPQGLMTHDQAKTKKLGGRLIAYCY